MTLRHSDKDRLNHVVARALRDTIRTHGPITEQTSTSAAKRITGQVISYLESHSLTTQEVDHALQDGHHDRSARSNR